MTVTDTDRLRRICQDCCIIIARSNRLEYFPISIRHLSCAAATLSFEKVTSVIKVNKMSNMPELGSKISLISKADIRYEGRLFTVDPNECTIALASGKSELNSFFFIAFQNISRARSCGIEVAGGLASQHRKVVFPAKGRPSEPQWNCGAFWQFRHKEKFFLKNTHTHLGKWRGIFVFAQNWRLFSGREWKNVHVTGGGSVAGSFVWPGYSDDGRE